MCGRLDLTPTPVLNDFLDRHRLPHITPSTNVAPTETVPVIIQTKHLELHPMRWWLTPSWAPEPTTTFSMFNARAETLTTSRAFKAPFQRRRCVIPVSGFYEWKQEADGKQPYRMTAGTSPLLLGGIWDIWERNGAHLESFAIITTGAVPGMEWLHNRQPLIVPESNLAEWLDPETPTASLGPYLFPHLPFPLLAAPVNRAVGNSRYKGDVSNLGDPVTIET